MKSVPNLSLPQVLSAPIGDFDTNCRPDPACGNFGVSADMTCNAFWGATRPR